MSPAFKTRRHQEGKELDFEVRHQMTLTTQERFDAMISLSIELIKLAYRHGHRPTAKVVKRS